MTRQVKYQFSAKGGGSKMEGVEGTVVPVVGNGLWATEFVTSGSNINIESLTPETL